MLISLGDRIEEAVTAPWKLRLVGRGAELAVLGEERRRSAGREFRLVLLTGEAGTGKSRLAAELARRSRGSVVLSARAYPLGETHPYFLWGEALEGHLRERRPEDVVRLCGGFLDDLAALLRSVAAVQGSAPEREPSRPRLAQSLVVLLGNLSSEAPVVVVLDDVHMADASSWQMLHYVARNLPTARLLVIATARPAELAEHEVALPVLFDLEQEGLVRRLALGPLGDEALRELAAQATCEQPPLALVGWLAQRSQGNPLFALSLLSALMEEGRKLDAPTLRSVPQDLAERVRRRLAVLDEAAVTTAEVLAVLGRPLEIDDLAVLAGMPVEHLSRGLQALARAGLVVETGSGQRSAYQMAHPLVEEVIQQNLAPSRRRALHRQLARAFQATGLVAEAASHFARSASRGDPEAVAALVEALRLSVEREAYLEVLSVLGTLAELLPSSDERWMEVLDALSWQAEWELDHRADVHAQLGIRAMREIESVLDAGPNPDVRALATVKARLASFLAWGTGELEPAESACRQAVELFERVGDMPRALLSAVELATIRALRGDLLDAVGEAAAAVEAAEAIGDPIVTLPVLGTIGYGALFTGHFDQAEALFRRSIAVADEHGKLYRLAWSLAALAWTLALEGRVEDALSLLEQAKVANATYRDAPVLEYETIVKWVAGDFGGALGSAREAVRWNPRMGRRRAIGMVFASLSAVEADDLADADRHLSMAHASLGDRPWLFYNDCHAWARGVVAWRRGERSEAIARLQRAATRAQRMGAWPIAALMLVDLAELGADSGEPEVADEAASQLSEISANADRDLYRGLSCLGRAWSRLAGGSAEAAVQSAREATKLLGGTGCQAFLGRALEVVGRSLGPSERPEAIEALNGAAGIFEACGARWRRDRARQRLRSLGGRGGRTAASRLGPASLTRRERDVARLAGHGHTAREIAERLSIADRTVEWHLANVYSKLGIGSKVDLVRRLPELGI